MANKQRNPVEMKTGPIVLKSGTAAVMAGVDKDSKFSPQKKGARAHMANAPMVSNKSGAGISVPGGTGAGNR